MMTLDAADKGVEKRKKKRTEEEEEWSIKGKEEARRS